jgi:hypothetical protein
MMALGAYVDVDLLFREAAEKGIRFSLQKAFTAVPAAAHSKIMGCATTKLTN